MGGDKVRRFLQDYLVATPDAIFGRGWAWQLVTSPLLEMDFVALLLHAFMLWMFLPALERWWGQKRFLLFALYTSVAGSLAGTAVAMLLPHTGARPISGLSPFVFAGIVAYGRLFSKQPVSFFGVLPMTGRQLTIGIVVVTLLMIGVGQDWPYGASLVAAMLLAVAMTSERYSPRILWLKLKQRRIRSRLKVVSSQEPKRWN
jgi:membrane associated rhomboid family serine protease